MEAINLDENGAQPAQTPQRPVPYPVPLLPDLQIPVGFPQPSEIHFHLKSRTGATVATVDIEETERPDLAPGIYYATAAWPLGNGKPQWYPGGIRRLEIALTTPPPPPADDRILVMLDQVAARLGELQQRLALLERSAPAAAPGGMDAAIMMKILDRAFQPPPPPPDPMQQLQAIAALTEQVGGWRQRGEIAPPPRAPSGGELAITALDRVGAMVGQLPESVARAAAIKAGGLDFLAGLKPGLVVEQLGKFSAAQIGDWLASAVESGVLDGELIGPETGGILADVLRVGPAWREKLIQAVQIADRLLEPAEAAAEVPKP